MIPSAKSRDQIGKSGAKDLLAYFIDRFGSPQSASFATAREHFSRSLAAYAVVSFLLSVKVIYDYIVDLLFFLRLVYKMMMMVF